MNWEFVKNDFLRNKVINLALLLFVTFSAGLATLSVMMGVQTVTSIFELYDKAQPPHFLQMHKGTIDQEEIDDFMTNYEDVTYWQTVEMINVDGESLSVVGDNETYNLSDNRLGIGLVKQNESRDLLLDSDHEKVFVDEGEIGISMLLKNQYNMEIGDLFILTYDDVQYEFVIKEFILDAQMNSPMVSSTRLLIHPNDFDMLKSLGGETEYIIEAYFTDSKEASGFQTAYEKAGLPQNGQAVTYAMIFLLSAITDITTVFVLLLVSILLVTVSFICLKFTIMAALEEEITEIGTMKAIGFQFKDIRNIYLVKYRIIALIGVTLGYIIALLSSSVFTNHINTTFGNMRLSLLAMLSALVVGVIVYLIINYYCKKVLKKIKKVTVVDALVRGKSFEKDKGNVRDGFYKSRIFSVNWLMAIREIVFKFKNWIIVFSVVFISVLMIMIPINLMNTFDSPEFITYMGSSLEDILIEVENGDNLESNYDKVVQVLENDDSIENYYEYRRVRVQTENADNELMNLHIDIGDNAGNQLKYISGGAPDLDNEIAISYLNINEIGKEIGDVLVLYYDGKEVNFTISGIYQDVTSGGYTAKSKFDFPELSSEKYTFSVNLNEHAEAEEKANEWSEMIGSGVSIDPMEEFINQTLGGVVKQLTTVVLFVVAIGASLVILITVLFLKLRLVKDLSEIAILKAIGFSKLDIKKQYLIKMGVVSIIGILFGIALTGILGDKIVSVVLSVTGLGLKSVELIVNPLIQYILVPVLLLALVLLATWIVLGAIKKYNIIAIINE